MAGESIIRAAVAGAHGKMGRLAVETLRGEEKAGIAYAGGLVRPGATTHGCEYVHLARLLSDGRPHVLVDFTHFPESKRIALGCIEHGVRPVIGTSGYGAEDVAELRAACDAKGIGAVFAPNFALGAILMMKFAETAAKHYADVEIVEMHESGKKDAPSGTALATARRLSRARAFNRAETALTKIAGARGADADGVGIHSLRLPGVVAHQEVLFGGDGETLTIRHDVYSRESFMRGMLVAVRAAADLTAFVDGLEALL